MDRKRTSSAYYGLKKSFKELIRKKNVFCLINFSKLNNGEKQCNESFRAEMSSETIYHNHMIIIILLKIKVLL